MNIENNTWRQLALFQSASTVQALLKKRYEKTQHAQAETFSYDNSYPFMYYIEQSEAFYKQATISPLSIQPILQFYGFAHLLKACILTIDPLYPHNTAVLAHGVSSRKRKKRHYHFFEDEVFVQKNGLFTHVAKQMFHVEQLEGEKYKMGELLRLIPELDDAFHLLKGSKNFIYLKDRGSTWEIPKQVADLYYMDRNRLQKHLTDKHQGQLQWTNTENHTELHLPQTAPVGLGSPFRYHLYSRKYGLPSKLHQNNDLPDVLVHYLLLYNLSMIARYETEWWCDLIKTNATHDYPFIQAFLSVHEDKGPYLLLQCLKNNLDIQF